MRCPVDETELRMTERQGIEIDYCPQCRGVWLDRGELDKMIERGSSYEDGFDERPARRGSDEPRERDWDEPRERDWDERREGRYERPPGHRRKRKGFLGDLFEFD